MARRSQRVSLTKSSHKRAHSDDIKTSDKRAKASTTPTSNRNGASDKGRRTNRKIKKQSSDLDDSSQSSLESDHEGNSDFSNSANSSLPSQEESDEDEYDSEVSEKPRKKSTSRKSGQATATIRSKTDELWRPGVSAGLGPGTQVVIKKPKARAAGKTSYRDETIHPNTLLFLAELKENNDRQWLKMHDPDFRQSEKDWHSFVEKLTERLAEVDDTVPELPVKDVIFRIYRDVRFSSDPTPYKPHFSAAWSRTGRKGPYAHYYIQVSPNNESFIEFLDACPKDASKAVKAFVSTNSGNALKTKPKGYDADHADINLLRLRNFTVGRKLEEKEILSQNVMERVVDLFRSMKPFITYLNSVVMPDEAQSSSEEESGTSEGDESEESANV